MKGFGVYAVGEGDDVVVLEDGDVVAQAESGEEARERGRHRHAALARHRCSWKDSICLRFRQ